VTHFARSRNTRRLVIRIRRVVIVCQVTRSAGRRRNVVVVIHVTLRTLQGSVCSGQREVCERRMVEGSGAPCNVGVAYAAIMREASLYMVRIRRAGKVFLMASVAIGRRPLITSAGVTCRTVERGMNAQQCIAGVLQVVELRSQPGIH